MKMKNSVKVIIFYVALIAVILFAASSLLGGDGNKATSNDIVNYFKNEQVEKFNIDGNNILKLTLKAGNDPKVVEFELRSLDWFEAYLGDIVREQTSGENPVISDFHIEPVARIPWWINLLPYLLMAIIVAVVYFSLMSQAGGRGGKMNSFGRARTKLGSDEKNNELSSQNFASVFDRIVILNLTSGPGTIAKVL